MSARHLLDEMERRDVIAAVLDRHLHDDYDAGDRDEMARDVLTALRRDGWMPPADTPKESTSA